MDFLERFNSKFGSWYEGLFGGDAGELRPKDVLRKITSAMDDHRKEGLDGKVYVPNKYILELAFDDPEERDYLLSFLDEEELVTVLGRFLAQNQYHTRGPLDFVIAEVPESERGTGREKLRVRARFERGEISPSAHSPSPVPSLSEDLPTVAAIDFDEPGTVPAVAWAALAITAPDGRKSHFSLTRPQITIGRSRNSGNDLILDNDGMVSKSHVRLERERDGRFTLHDLGSTNGARVNGVRIEGSRLLSDGDEMIVGATKLVFQQAGDESEPALPLPPRREREGMHRPRLVTPDGREHVLASETLIGRAITSDIILDGPGVATRHARIISPDPLTCYLETLSPVHETLHNSRPVSPGQSMPLVDGDLLVFGGLPLRFLGGTA
jgi:pSer/pThr/pTyr-binding forkhead associated (FHA) protein